VATLAGRPDAHAMARHPRLFPYRLGASFAHDFPDADSLSTECVINVVLAAQLLETLLATLLRPRQLSMGTVNVLEILRGAGQALPPSVIGERLLITRATVTALVDSLERRRLVRRRPHPGDRRMLLVELTSDGLAMVEGLMPAIHGAERTWAADLNPAEKEALVNLLGKLQRRLETERVARHESTATHQEEGTHAHQQPRV
jgi:DNA-binding MarR family transcriptional regulator